MRIGFLASHNGSNAQAIIDACESGELPAQPVVAVSNNGAAAVLERARRHGIPSYHLSAKTAGSEDALDREMLRLLRAHGVSLLVLAGYMRKVGPATVAAFEGRIVNIHPALLPKFGGQGMYGIRVHEAVLQAGEAETGITIHLADGEYDRGRILAQCRVPVEAGDTPETLAVRVLNREHRFYVETLAKIASGEIELPALTEAA